MRVRFHQYAWGLLIYNLAVVVWGAYVRATGSGAGCGSHWPTCDGGAVTQSGYVKTLVEFSHRAQAGVLLISIFGLAFWAWRAFPKGHPARLGAALSILFCFTEAFLGAALVLFGLVDKNDSISRVIVMSAHLINTFILITVLTLTAWWGSGGKAIRLRGQGAIAWMFGLGLLSTLLLGVTGAINALGDTLFPSGTLLEGIRQDFSPTAHFLLRLRVLHPFCAASVSLYLILIAGLATHLRPSPQVRQFARWTGVMFLAQMGVGLVNLMLQAPVAMQLTHLLMGDTVWIVLVLLSASALAVDVPQVEAINVGAMANLPLAAGAATWKDYIALTKPRVISLLLFTTITAMVIAAGGWPGTGLVLATGLGLYMAAGAANAINMVLEQDLDARMKRTAIRPIVAQKIPAPNALQFAFALAVGSFALLWAAASLMSALMALSGLVFYVVIYTMLLKRRTWGNIVIGGAAGAFPPLVGWAAVNPHLGPLALCLFGIIFVWTPVHFWALALLIKEDYAEAGVPMLPVVHGDHATVVQIAFYAVLTALISIAPWLMHDPISHARSVGGLYLGVAVLLNGVLLWRSVQLYQRPEKRQASSLFHYSMLYLALLFLAMAIDRTQLI
ncbi:MAG: protoheme IX farnesyltransferase [Abitibacteriaceae bacterium]|nr:protoheme IX farnesyltransferase [Abditibacteriaceae bacterium]